MHASGLIVTHYSFHLCMLVVHLCIHLGWIMSNSFRNMMLFGFNLQVIFGLIGGTCQLILVFTGCVVQLISCACVHYTSGILVNRWVISFGLALNCLAISFGLALVCK